MGLLKKYVDVITMKEYDTPISKKSNFSLNEDADFESDGSVGFSVPSVIKFYDDTKPGIHVEHVSEGNNVDIHVNIMSGRSINLAPYRAKIISYVVDELRLGDAIETGVIELTDLHSVYITFKSLDSFPCLDTVAVAEEVLKRVLMLVKPIGK